MIIRTVNALVSILSGMRINKITDKSVKTTLVNDYLYLRRFSKQANEDEQEIRSKFQKDWADEIPDVNAQRDANSRNKTNNPIVGHDAYLKAEADAWMAIQELANRDVESLVKSIPMDAFMSACGNEELSLEQIATLKEGGVIE